MSGGAVVPCPNCPRDHHCWLHDYAPTDEDGVYEPTGEICGDRYRVRIEVVT